MFHLFKESIGMRQKEKRDKSKVGKKMLPTLGGLLMVGVLAAPVFGTAQEKTTTIQETTTSTTVPATKKKVPATTSTTTTTEITTKETQPRQVLDVEALKKMEDTLCADGFKAYVGTDKNNVCQTKATAPDIAYSCVWDKQGTAAFAPTAQGPCKLDFTNHSGSIVVTKTEYDSPPPLSYGKEAQCCFRAAQGPDVVR